MWVSMTSSEISTGNFAKRDSRVDDVGNKKSFVHVCEDGHIISKGTSDEMQIHGSGFGMFAGGQSC